MSRIIQISDSHIVPKGELAYGKVDTAIWLEKSVETINRIQAQLDPIDLVVVTGDLVDYGTAEEYQRFKDIMAPLTLPYLAVPGNHDNREIMREAFSDQKWMPKSGDINWTAKAGDFLVVGLDTLVSGKAYGALTCDSLDFLENALKDHKAGPALVCLHHPPFHTGIEAMDKQNLRDATRLREILESHEGYIRLLCGHVHRNIIGQFGRVICQISPAVGHAVNLDQRLSSTNCLNMEPGAFLMHEWRNGIISHAIPNGQFEGPWPFDGFEPVL